ncbi:alpha/beta hydrolase family protein [Hymenobacter weizhouensis]|uniref:alpha/beta hydrolase family protein n=1 Tax=Hymenobacter sp. YIM 151500-1 TaxID=2987689 RepID=UPI0022276F4C|nr:alpha/beta fold hydrolase [Hymenobacter sp. YIM 151500-1]UYZ63843.1 alpha/beta fold hydrolase [Hymenobacter sp. YIM 151500-1]
MKKLPLLLALLLLFITARGQAPHSPAGLWQGALNLPTTQLRVQFRLTAREGGSLTGTISVPQQNLQDMPFSGVVVRADSVLATLEKLQARFRGRLSASGQELTGVWQQSGAQLPLALTRTSEAAVAAAAPRRPQLPVGPFPYRSEDVTFANPTANLSLAGTLTLPAGQGPFPAVVLVSGSGPQDRDETIFGHKPFLVLADYLTRRGFAVLRYDDRGVGQSQGTHAGATTADFTTDAQAALAYLRRHPGIKPRRVGMIGHSEGGLIVWQAAAQPAGPDVAVTLAGTGLPGTEVLLRQQTDLGRAAGLDTAALGQIRRVHTALFAEMRRLPATLSQDELRQQLATKLRQLYPSLSQDQALAQTKSIAGPWLRYFLLTDPAGSLRQVKCPVLALNGTKDLQVAADVHLPAIERALKAGGNRNVTVRALPGLNHLFQTAATGSEKEYATIEETFSPAALEIIGTWLAQHAK